MRFLTLTPLMLALAAPVAYGSETDVEAARAAAGELGKRLKGELQAALQTGGPVSALGVCQDRAPQIAQEIGTARGLTVGRTSLRTRNPDNRPDIWELEGLLAFDRARGEGKPPEHMEISAVVETGDRREFRYMKAIPTAELCLQCHGEQLDDAVTAELRQRYPDDQATGFKAGDIRGAFTVRRALD